MPEKKQNRIYTPKDYISVYATQTGAISRLLLPFRLLPNKVCHFYPCTEDEFPKLYFEIFNSRGPVSEADFRIFLETARSIEIILSRKIKTVTTISRFLNTATAEFRPRVIKSKIALP